MGNGQTTMACAHDDVSVIFVAPESSIPAWAHRGPWTTRHVERSLLGALVIPMLARGAVVVVAPAEDATAALALGADEVVAFEELSEATLATAVTRSRARFEGRRRRERHVVDLVRADDRAPFELFARAVADLIAGPLDRAVRCLDGAESSTELRRQSRTEIERIEQLVAQLRYFGEPGSDASSSDATLVVSRACDVIVPLAEQVAKLTTDIGSEPCIVPMPAWQLTHAVLALVQNALGSLATGVEEPTVDLRVLAEEDFVVIEVCDNGRAMDPETRLHALDPFVSRDVVGERLGLSLVSVRARRAGGELLIDSLSELGTAARIFLPRVRCETAAAVGLERN